MGFRNYSSGPARMFAGTATTSFAAAVVAASPQRKFLLIHNPSAAAILAFTLDGSTAVVNGNGVTVGPGGSFLFDEFVPTGAMGLISSVASSPYTILVEQ